MPEKKPTAIDLSNYVDPVRAAREFGNARTPRLYKEFVDEFCNHVSDQVSRGEWFQHPDAGAINATGQNVAEYFEQTFFPTRGHGQMPTPIADGAKETWLSENGAPLNITRQGQRLVELGGDRDAFAREAAFYGATVGSTKPGIDPDDPEAKRAAKSEGQSQTSGARNPWSASFIGSDADRITKLTQIMKQGGSFARDLAKAAGTSITKPLPRKR